MVKRSAWWCLALLASCLTGLCGCMLPPGAAGEQGVSYGDHSGGTDAVAPAAVQRPNLDPERRERLVVYNGAVWLVVERIADSLQQVQQRLEALGGYMQELTANSITLKVPAPRFPEAIAAVEQLGEVTKKEIKGADVTEQVRDLRIRLENSEQLRQRLLKLLEKSDKVEDTLKVEQELARVTEAVEMLKGKLQYVETQVALSTLTVHLNSALPQREVTAEIPFAWVYELGEDMSSGEAGETSAALPLWRGVKFRLPEAYIQYLETDDETRAMSADRVMIRLHRHPNFAGGDLAFWAALVRRTLVEQRTIAVKDPTDVRLRTGVAARLLAGTREIGGKPYGYLVAVIARRCHVYAFEAWGPLDAFTRDQSKLEGAIRSIRVGPLHRLLLTLF